MAKAIGDDINCRKGFGFTKVRSDYGEGVVSVTVVSDDISVIIIDATFKKDFEVQLLGDSKKTIDFVFCLEGSIHHRFGAGTSYKPINFRQNTIINRGENSRSVIKIPSNVPLKISLISYRPNYDKLQSEDLYDLRLSAFNILTKVYAEENHFYSGRVCFRTSNFVSDMMKYGSQNPADILFKEAAILNTMASQIDRHDKDLSSGHDKAPIKLYEVDRILALETFINDNLTESLTLSRLELVSGLNPSKLQAGFKYLYGKTVSHYVTEKRLEKAAKLIYESDLNVSELVYSVGFTSRSYFSKIFKNHFGVLPSKCIANPELLAIN
ncbi:MAG: helix-turn-helix transcriptional regulator [Algicola sp.]|nr:helix-turn-helix transcriptional regulator [Algicola sp.]